MIAKSFARILGTALQNAGSIKTNHIKGNFPSFFGTRSLSTPSLSDKNSETVKAVKQPRPGSYLGAVLKEFGAPLVLEDVPVAKKLKPDEVRVRNYVCGIHALDVSIIKGEWWNKPELPFIPGFEVAGKIEEIGKNVKKFKKGDRVICFNREECGGFAQQCIAPAKDIWKVPDSLGFGEAAILLDSYSLAYLAMNRRARIKPGDIVLVTHAHSGLGLAAVDVAANVFKARVIALCNTEDNAQILREKGAWAALKYHRDHMFEVVEEVSDGAGANIIFETVGGNMFLDSIECVAHEGRVIVGGFASCQIPSIETSLLLPRSFALIGVSLTHYRMNKYEIYRETIEEVIEMAEDKYVKPTVSSTFKLEQVNEAIDFIVNETSLGTPLLVCND